MLMMLMMSIICLRKILNRSIWLLVKLLCSENVQLCVFQILEQNLHDMAHFRGYQLFSALFQVMSVVSWFVSDSSWMVSGGFRWFPIDSLLLVLVRT